MCIQNMTLDRRHMYMTLYSYGWSHLGWRTDSQLQWEMNGRGGDMDRVVSVMNESERESKRKSTRMCEDENHMK